MPTPDMLARDAAEYQQMAPPALAKPVTPASAILRRLVWVGAFLLIGFFALDGFISFGMQSGAPQQGAVAAWGAFRIVAVYTLARALDEATR